MAEVRIGVSDDPDKYAIVISDEEHEMGIEINLTTLESINKELTRIIRNAYAKQVHPCIKEGKLPESQPIDVWKIKDQTKFEFTCSREYYRSSAGELFCHMANEKNNPSWYICSKDGEPIDELDFSKYHINIKEGTKK